MAEDARGLVARLARLLARRDCAVPEDMTSPGLWVLLQVSLRGLAPLVAALVFLPQPAALVLLGTTLLLYLAVASDHDDGDGAGEMEMNTALTEMSTTANAASDVPTPRSAAASSVDLAVQPYRSERSRRSGQRSPFLHHAWPEVALVGVGVAVLCALGLGLRDLTTPVWDGEAAVGILVLWVVVILVTLLALSPFQRPQRSRGRPRVPPMPAWDMDVVTEIHGVFAVLSALLATLSAAALLTHAPGGQPGTWALRGLAVAQLLAVCIAFASVRLAPPPRRRDAQAQIQARTRLLERLGWSFILIGIINAATLATALGFATSLRSPGLWLSLASPWLLVLACGAVHVYLGHSYPGQRAQARLYEVLVRAGSVPHRPGWPRPSFAPISLPLTTVAGPLACHGVLFLLVVMPLVAAHGHGGGAWNGATNFALVLELIADALQLLLAGLRVLALRSRRDDVRWGFRFLMINLALTLGIRSLEALTLATGGVDVRRIRDALRGSVVLFYASGVWSFVNGISLAGDAGLSGPVYMLLAAAMDYVSSPEALASARGTLKVLLGVAMPTALAIPVLSVALCLVRGATVTSLSVDLDAEGALPASRGGDAILCAVVLSVVFLTAACILALFCRLHRPLYLPFPVCGWLPCSRTGGVITAVDTLLLGGIVQSFTLAVALFASDSGNGGGRGCAVGGGVLLLLASLAGAMQRLGSAEGGGRLRVEAVYQEALVLHSRLDAQRQALLVETGEGGPEGQEDQLVPGEHYTWRELLDARPGEGSTDGRALEQNGGWELAGPTLEARLWVRTVDRLGGVSWAPWEEGVECRDAVTTHSGQGDVEAPVQEAEQGPRERLYLRRLRPRALSGGAGSRSRAPVGGAEGEIEWLDGRSALPEEDRWTLGDLRQTQPEPPRRRPYLVPFGERPRSPPDAAPDAPLSRGVRMAFPAHPFCSHLFARVAELPFEGKVTFLRAAASRLRVPWDVGHEDVSVRRAALLDDSVRAFAARDAPDFRQVFRFSFADDGTTALDAGGVAREWYTLVTQELFHDTKGLFRRTEGDDTSYELRTVEEVEAWRPEAAEPSTKGEEREQEKAGERPSREGHGFGWREGFRFCGRFLGKALLDAQVVPHARLSRALCKHVLGRPVGLMDLADAEPTLCRSLMWLLEHDGVKAVGLFDQDDSAITDENKAAYVTRMVEMRLLRQAEGPLLELLAGFYEVVPLGLVSVLTPTELARLLEGEQRIDVADWKAHTAYNGLAKRNSRVVGWWWDFVTELEVEDRARLLQFITGSSRVPVGGFRYLAQGDSQRRSFAILGVPLGDGPGEAEFPRAHTCFNRIDLPMYKRREELQKALEAILDMEVTGFSME